LHQPSGHKVTMAVPQPPIQTLTMAALRLLRLQQLQKDHILYSS